jgi:signal transduction histidine kinase
LQSLAQVCAFDRGTLFTRSPGGLLLLIACEGGDRIEWMPNQDQRSPWHQAWTERRAVRGRVPFTGTSPTNTVVIPMCVDGRVIALVGLERAVTDFAETELEDASKRLNDRALRLDTALLFDEVRAIATTEERRRLAREIHDGIAQELASLGYSLDDIAARADGTESSAPELGSRVRLLRSELSRVVSELRLSIFELRAEVGPATSLTAALAEHARTIGATSGITVYLELSETPTRLRVETEAELLRIAQEAMTNARKHSGAENLWVTCRIAPPQALLRVEDDGRGLGTAREDSFGLDIMRERATRVGAQLRVGLRPGGGTSVEVEVTGPAASEGRTSDADNRAAR